MSAIEPRATFRGARVGKKAAAWHIETPAHPQVKHYSTIGYEIAMANRHKSWAKRWLRTHRYGKFI